MKILRVLSLLFTAPLAALAIPTLLSSVVFNGNDGSNTSVAINTTGATLLGLVVINSNGTAFTISDNKANTWNLAAASSGADAVFYYAYGSALSVGAGHTATISPAAQTTGRCMFFAFGGATGPLDRFSIATHNYGNPMNTGSITPSANGELLISGFSSGNTSAPFTIDSSFAVFGSENSGGANSNGIAAAYLVQASAAAVNPAWSMSGTSFVGTFVASFPAIAPPAGTPPNPSQFIIF
jgi:hypothetical protein